MHLVYALGSNGSGQLGVGHREDCSQPLPVQLNHEHEVKRIVAGGNHTLFLLGDGSVLASGSNESGQCALDRTTHSNCLIPSPISHHGTLGDVQHVAATWNASIFATRKGELFVVGQGPNGELGLGPELSECSTLTKVPTFPPSGMTIACLSSCMAHTVCILSNGEVYGWGRGRKGQLGQPSGDVWQPRRIEGITFRAVSVDCGRDFSCILGSDGQVLMLGPGKLDRFGVKANAPDRLAEASKNVFASWGSVFATRGPARAQQIEAWGRNDHGQLGPANGIPPIQFLAAGSEHCLALTASGEVIAWGWGEHGNCGLPMDDAGDVKGQWNTIALPVPPVNVFAGCATSFIVAKSKSSILPEGKAASQSNKP